MSAMDLSKKKKNARGTYAQNYCSYFMDKCVQTIFLRHIILLS